MENGNSTLARQGCIREKNIIKWPEEKNKWCSCRNHPIAKCILLKWKKDLKEIKYSNCNPFSEKIVDPVLESVAKYCSHPSIKTIGSIPKLNNLFSFATASKNEDFIQVASFFQIKIMPRFLPSCQSYKENKEFIFQISPTYYLVAQPLRSSSLHLQNSNGTSNWAF